ncbi:MAG TPA: hypothetical protein VHW26_01730 [Solirubrobacteraceae bacterium]|jgi:hypothetical protein|nr:hypothetical protein [Solirubrobacteraceae bacterium]
MLMTGVGRPRRRLGRIAVGVLVILVLIAGVAVVLHDKTSKSPTTPAVIHPVQKTTTNGAAGNQVPVAAHVPQTPFELAGARFAVFVNSRETWTAFAKTVSPGPGNRWVLVAVRVRNLTRTGFDPRVLHYRLMAPGNLDFFPDLTYGTGPNLHLPPSPLAIGALTQAELAFKVPTSASGLQLAFDPTSGQHERVVVSLGQ